MLEVDLHERRSLRFLLASSGSRPDNADEKTSLEVVSAGLPAAMLTRKHSLEVVSAGLPAASGDADEKTSLEVVSAGLPAASGDADKKTSLEVISAGLLAAMLTRKPHWRCSRPGCR